MKICIKCGEEKPATSEFFHSRKDSKSGLRNECKECVLKRHRESHVANRERNNERSRRWHTANKERAHENSRKWREANKERCKENNSKWYIANREDAIRRASQWQVVNRERHAEFTRKWNTANRERMIHYRIANKERRTEYQQKWRVANRERSNSYGRNRDALKRNAEGCHSAADIQQQYKAQKGKCYYCGVKVGKTYHVDHVIPLSRGGSNGIENLVIACPGCNLSKKDKLPHEWVQGGRLI